MKRTLNTVVCKEDIFDERKEHVIITKGTPINIIGENKRDGSIAFKIEGNDTEFSEPSWKMCSMRSYITNEIFMSQVLIDHHKRLVDIYEQRLSNLNKELSKLEQQD